MNRCLFLIVALLLGACSSKFQRIEPAPAIQPGQTMGVLPVNFLDQPAVQVISNPIKYASTVAAIAIAKGDDTKERQFSGAMEALGYDYREHVNRLLFSNLESAGFEAGAVDFRRSIDNILEDVPPGRFEKRYPRDTEYDLLLDVYVDYVGYAAPTVTADYRPAFHIGARVVDAKSLKTLYQSRLMYHPFEPDPEDVTIRPGEDHIFPGFDDLMAEPERARDGLEEAVRLVLARLTVDMSNGHTAL